MSVAAAVSVAVPRIVSVVRMLWLIVANCVPSATVSSTALTYTVRGVRQFVESKTISTAFRVSPRSVWLRPTTIELRPAAWAAGGGRGGGGSGPRGWGGGGGPGRGGTAGGRRG